MTARVAVGLAALGLLLLTVSTALLWRLADTASELERIERTNAARSAEDLPEPPPLPASSGEGSAKALVAELDRTTDELAQPLTSLEEQLSGLSGNSAALGEIVPALRALGGTVSGIEADLAPTLRSASGGVAALKRSATDLRSLVRQARGLRSIQPQLRRLVRDLRQLRSIRKTLGSLRGDLKRMTELMEELVKITKDTQKSVERTNECLEQPVICRGG